MLLLELFGEQGIVDIIEDYVKDLETIEEAEINMFYVLEEMEERYRIKSVKTAMKYCEIEMVYGDNMISRIKAGLKYILFIPLVHLIRNGFVEDYGYDIIFNGMYLLHDKLFY